jgi:hypothetical protein
MPSTRTASGLFLIDEDYDTGHASNRTSRYLAYCELNRTLFTDYGGTDEPITADPLVYAVAAWQCATGPIMSPPYVQRTVPEILSIALHRSADTGDLLADIDVVTPRPAELRSGLGAVNDWSFQHGYAGSYGYYTHPDEPYLALRPTILSSTKLILPIGKEDLLQPTRRDQLTVTDVKTSVHAVAELLDDALYPFLAALGRQ